MAEIGGYMLKRLIKAMKGRRYSRVRVRRERGTQSLVEFFASSHPSAHLTTWILICKWNLNFVGNFALGNLSRAAFVFGSFHDELQLYGLFSHPDSFRDLFVPFIPIPFFSSTIYSLPSICLPSPPSIYASFSPVGRELSRRMPDREEELAAWNSRTDWILIIPAFLLRLFHVLRFFFFPFAAFAGSRHPRYALPHIAKTLDPRKGTEVMAEAEWKKQTSIHSCDGSMNHAYERYAIAIEIPSLLCKRQIILH